MLEGFVNSDLFLIVLFASYIIQAVVISKYIISSSKELTEQRMVIEYLRIAVHELKNKEK